MTPGSLARDRANGSSTAASSPSKPTPAKATPSKRKPAAANSDGDTPTKKRKALPKGRKTKAPSVSSDDDGDDYSDASKTGGSTKKPKKEIKEEDVKKEDGKEEIKAPAPVEESDGGDLSPPPDGSSTFGARRASPRLGGFVAINKPRRGAPQISLLFGLRAIADILRPTDSE